MALDVGELHINANGLEELAKLRDKLFHAAIRVYNWVLLRYTIFIQQQRPGIHLLKAVLMSHDFLAYICEKPHFDTLSDSNILMQEYMKLGA